MADCYKFKEKADIDKNFSNNLDIVISLPKYHLDVFWDIGRDLRNISEITDKSFKKESVN